MSQDGLRICVLGGTGFIGTKLVMRLASEGHWVRVPTRHLSHGDHLRVLPKLELMRANVHEPRVLSRLVSEMDVVVNLIGIANEPGLGGGSGFRRVHADLAAKVVEAMRMARVPRLLHMSALGANAEHGRSHYLRSKGLAEQHLRAAGLHVDYTIFRPSVIFGPGDTLTNRFAGLLRIAFGFLPLARAGARFAPIYVDDVVEAYMRALRDRSTHSQTYELCGPEVMTLAELIRLTGKAAGIKARILPLPDMIARAQGMVMGLLPGKPFSYDNFKSLTIDNVCKDNGCARLGIQPRHMTEGFLRTYL